MLLNGWLYMHNEDCLNMKKLIIRTNMAWRHTSVYLKLFGSVRNKTPFGALNHCLYTYMILNPYMIAVLTYLLWWCLQGWQRIAAVKQWSGIIEFWRAMPAGRGAGWASMTSLWVYCPPVDTIGTAAWQIQNYDWKLLFVFLFVFGLSSALLWFVCDWRFVLKYSTAACDVHVFVHVPQVLLENDLFHCCLVACCLEISICSLCLSCDFPQVLHILSLAPYHFWKVCLLSLLAKSNAVYLNIKHLLEQLAFYLYGRWTPKIESALCPTLTLSTPPSSAPYLTGDRPGVEGWSGPVLCCGQTPRPSGRESFRELGLGQRLTTVGGNPGQWVPTALLSTGL